MNPQDQPQNQDQSQPLSDSSAPQETEYTAQSDYSNQESIEQPITTEPVMSTDAYASTSQSSETSYDTPAVTEPTYSADQSEVVDSQDQPDIDNLVAQQTSSANINEQPNIQAVQVEGVVPQDVTTNADTATATLGEATPVAEVSHIKPEFAQQKIADKKSLIGIVAVGAIVLVAIVALTVYLVAF